MKRAMRFLRGRLFWVAVLLGLQLFFLISLLTLLSRVQIAVDWAMRLGSLLVALWIAGKEDNPSYKLAWCIPILLFPILGGSFYLIFGRTGFSRRALARLERYTLPPDEDLRGLAAPEALEDAPMLARQARYMTCASGYPLYQGTQAEYFALGEQLFPVLKAELERAAHFILMEYFIIQPGVMWDAILEILARKAAQGVEVKLMYDHMGSIQTLPQGYERTLRELGLQVTLFNPLNPRLTSSINYRDHRKITVIDGNTGFCGGINLADEYINAYPKHGHWKDTAVLLRGSGVAGLTLMFLSLWQYSNQARLEPGPYLPTLELPGDGLVQPFGDSPLDRCNAAENAYLQVINTARRYIYITTPYLILDQEMVTALSVAARSGVDVRIVTPYVADKWYVHLVTRSFYPQLAGAGVRLYEYTPGFIHAKMLVCDDQVCMVGTTNMDYRSFYLHFECGVLFYRSSMVKKVREDVEKIIGASGLVSLSQSRSLAGRHRLLCLLLRVFAPLL